jgi:peptidoglycan/xylan/chitin deacetylase (PgdA/CDA1 family)
VSEVTRAAVGGRITEAKAPQAQPDASPASGVRGAHRWRPSPLVRAVFALHIAAALLLLVDLSWWPWLLGAVAASHLALSLAVLFPRASFLGANITRLPLASAARGEIALTFDDGPDPAITPRVLDLLDQYGMQATFFVIGENALAQPELTREIMRRGHQVENHSFHHHAHFSVFGYRALAREVETAQSALAQVTGRAPRFFRAPAGFRNPFLDPVLARRGLRYISWTRRGFDAVSRDPRQVLVRLTRGLAGGDVLLLHDGTRARTLGGEPVVLAALPALLEKLRADGLRSVRLDTAFAGPETAGNQ